MEGVPKHLRDGLERYLNEYILPGHFLTAVLENDLLGAVQHGDEESLAELVSLVRWLYNNAPMTAWGSKADVYHWVKRGQNERSIQKSTTRAQED